ncbi:MAG: SCP2 sterol-binding domain-containing protein [Myxococcales bacterium]|nr:SCP2 sterol-binding domain-containing protein [Myxococcales bacterium]
MDAKTLFNEKLPQLIEKEPDKARELDAIYLFNITGDNGGTWTVDVKSESPSIKEGDSGNAECSIEVTSEDFEAMMKDPQVGMQLYFQGKLKVSGNPMLATKLQQLFQMGGLG